MTNLPFVLFIVAPLALALTAHFWIWWQPTFRRLRLAVPTIDSGVVLISVPQAGITIQSLRNHDKIGDKVVTVHHLMRAVEDLLDILRTGAVFTTAGTIIVVLLVFLQSQNQQRAAQGGQQAQFQGIWDALTTTFSNVPLFFSVPVGQATLLLYFLGAFMFLWKQTKKYV